MYSVASLMNNQILFVGNRQNESDKRKQNNQTKTLISRQNRSNGTAVHKTCLSFENFVPMFALFWWVVCELCVLCCFVSCFFFLWPYIFGFFPCCCSWFRFAVNYCLKKCFLFGFRFECRTCVWFINKLWCTKMRPSRIFASVHIKCQILYTFHMWNEIHVKRVTFIGSIAPDGSHGAIATHSIKKTFSFTLRSFPAHAHTPFALAFSQWFRFTGIVLLFQVPWYFFFWLFTIEPRETTSIKIDFQIQSIHIHIDFRWMRSHRTPPQFAQFTISMYA